MQSALGRSIPALNPLATVRSHSRTPSPNTSSRLREGFGGLRLIERAGRDELAESERCPVQLVIPGADFGAGQTFEFATKRCAAVSRGARTYWKILTAGYRGFPPRLQQLDEPRRSRREDGGIAVDPGVRGSVRPGGSTAERPRSR